MNYIVALCYKNNGPSIKDALDTINTIDSLDLNISAFETRADTRQYLDVCAHKIPNTLVMVPKGESNKMRSAYRSDDLGLFICSTITYEERAEVANTNGEGFAKAILPESSKLILHMQSSMFPDSTFPSREILEKDYVDGVYHLPRDLRFEDTESASYQSLMDFVGIFVENGNCIDSEDYLVIVDSVPVKS